MLFRLMRSFHEFNLALGLFIRLHILVFQLLSTAFALSRDKRDLSTLLTGLNPGTPYNTPPVFNNPAVATAPFLPQATLPLGRGQYGCNQCEDAVLLVGSAQRLGTGYFLSNYRVKCVNTGVACCQLQPAQCLVNPCEANRCMNNPTAICIWNNCGGCYAKYFNAIYDEIRDCSTVPNPAAGTVPNVAGFTGAGLAGFSGTALPGFGTQPINNLNTALLNPLASGVNPNLVPNTLPFQPNVFNPAFGNVVNPASIRRPPMNPVAPAALAPVNPIRNVVFPAPAVLNVNPNTATAIMNSANAVNPNPLFSPLAAMKNAPASPLVPAAPNGVLNPAGVLMPPAADPAPILTALAGPLVAPGEMVCPPCQQGVVISTMERRCVDLGKCCPAGIIPVQCLVDPCATGAACPLYPTAFCVPNYCGNCAPSFFDKDWNRIQKCV